MVHELWDLGLNLHPGFNNRNQNQSGQLANLWIVLCLRQQSRQFTQWQGMMVVIVQQCMGGLQVANFCLDAKQLALQSDAQQ